MIQVTSFKDKPVAVLGLGRSGLAAAHALLAGGALVRAWDDEAPARTRAAGEGIPLADLAGDGLAGVHTLVLSPGIPHTHPAPHPVAEMARRQGCEIVCDIELMARSATEAAYIGVTGTNGKSTTTALLGHILAASGRDVEMGGNFGVPALALRPLGAGGTYVLELSSYQLELIHRAVCDVAVLLNITPDHLDRHGGWDGYVAAKKRIFANSAATAVAVIGVDDAPGSEIHGELVSQGRLRVIPVSAEAAQPGGVWVADGQLIDDLDNGQAAVLDLTRVGTLPGRHNWQNAAAAHAAARALGLGGAEVAAAIATYPGLAHRQERIRDLAGVAYVNDSKATNAEAAAKALVCYENIYWIAGGLAKEGGIEGTRPHLGAVRHAFLIGAAAQAFAAQLAGHVPLTLAGGLADALAQARSLAESEPDRPGRAVLLSPGAASFDQFKDFESRGEAFRALVDALS